MTTAPLASAPNTAVEYMFRDGDNYKAFAKVVLAGDITIAQAATALAHEDFLPEQVGLDSLAGTDGTNADHPWHELTDVSSTTEAPTLGGADYPTAAEWAQKFVGIVWDDAAASAAMEEG